MLETRSQTKGDRQRQAVLDAVNTLLHDVPIAELSVAQITAAAGLTRSGFYFYFDSKYAAVAAALAEAVDDLDRVTDHLARDDGESRHVYARRAITAARDVWAAHSSLLNACVQARDSDRSLAELWEFVLATLVSWLSQTAVDNMGTQLSGRMLEERVRLLVGMSTWAVHDDSVRRVSRARSDRTIDTLVDVWLGALGESGPDKA